MERLSEREKEEIARLSAMRLPSRLIAKQIGRVAIGRCGGIALGCVAPSRSRSFAVAVVVGEREEISRGLAGG